MNEGLGSFLGGLAGGFGSFIGNLVGGRRQEKIVDKQIAAQKEENAIAREWNLNLAKMQNQWNIDQWNRENAYNKPTNQRKLLREAGLNPDLYYADGAGSSLAAASPEMTAGAGTSPTDVSAYSQMPNNARQAVLDAAAIANSFADYSLKKANEKKVNNESDILSTEAFYKAAREKSEIRLTKLRCNLTEADTHLSEKAAEEKVAAINKINAEIGLIQQNVIESQSRVKVNDATVRDIENQIMWRDKKGDKEIQRIEAEIDRLAAAANLDKEKAKTVVMLATAQVKHWNVSDQLMSAETRLTWREMRLKDALIDMTKAKTEGFVLDNDLVERFGGYEKFAQIVTMYGNCLANLGEAAGSIATRGLSKLAKEGFKKSQSSNNAAPPQMPWQQGMPMN